MSFKTGGKNLIRAGTVASVAGLACCLGAVTAYAAGTVVGTVNLSSTPPQVTTSVAPNIAVTFDDSGSMVWTRMGDFPPFTTQMQVAVGRNNATISNYDWGGPNQPWRCAAAINPQATSGIGSHVMNGVYYNPNVTYSPPLKPDGTSFPNYTSLSSVPIDGIAFNWAANGATQTSSLDYYNNPDNSGITANNVVAATDGQQAILNGTKSGRNNDKRWFCGGSTLNYNINGEFNYQNTPTGYYGATGNSDGWGSFNGSSYTPATSPMDGTTHTLSDGTSVPYPNGGPYYYRFMPTKLSQITLNSSTGVPTTAGLAVLYNPSNWEAIPVPTNQYQNFANWYAYYRTRTLMARSSVATAFAGMGSNLRVAWQNLGNNTPGLFTSSSIISDFTDTNTTGDSRANNYRTQFFNWLYKIGAYNGTPTRGAIISAGKFFQRSGSTLSNPYWQPDGQGSGQELSCRQNFNLLVTDGFWNQDASLTTAGLLDTSTSQSLPDAQAFNPGDPQQAIYKGYSTDVSGGPTLSNIAFTYWATKLRDFGATAAPVPQYMPDQTTGIVGTNPTTEIYFNPNNDPATWPHLVQYMVSLGAGGELSSVPNDLDCAQGASDKSDACLLRTGQTNSTGAVGWPQPDGQANSGNGVAQNIDDLWHAAINSRGAFFLASDPNSLVNQLQKILKNITGPRAGSSGSVSNLASLTTNSAGYSGIFSTADWSGTLQRLSTNSTTGVENTAAPQWDAGCILTGSTCASMGGRDMGAASPSPLNRLVFTKGTGANGGQAFSPSNTTLLGANILGILGVEVSSLDQVIGTSTICVSVTLLGGTLIPGCDGGAKLRMAYLLGDRSQELPGAQIPMRKRSSVMGAVVNSQPLYVSSPSSGLVDNFPVGSPEANSNVTYQQFVQANKSREAAVYVGSGDGMLHAFDAQNGNELWAYLPMTQLNRVIRNNGQLSNSPNLLTGLVQGILNAVQNLLCGLLPCPPSTASLVSPSPLEQITDPSSTPPPGVDGSPYVQDAFIKGKWSSVLIETMRKGGRSVFAIDVTNANKAASDLQNDVLWEIDNNNPVDSNNNPVFPNLGYTYNSANITRLKNLNKWVALISSGYFANDPNDPSSTDPAQSGISLYVVDLETGAKLAEFRADANNFPNAPAWGLSTPSAYDIDGDQNADYAVAGDLAGNLWYFDLRKITTATVGTTTPLSPTLIFQTYGGSVLAGQQPISVQPIALRSQNNIDPVWVFGTGKYLGTCDRTSTPPPSGCGPDSNSGPQYIYGVVIPNVNVNDPNTAPPVQSSGASFPSAPSSLATLQLSEDGNGFRSISGPNPTANGWDIPLNLGATNPVDAGERVVAAVTPVYNSNRFIVSTLIPASASPCTPSPSGAAMIFDAGTGGLPGAVLANSAAPPNSVGQRLAKLPDGTIGGGSPPVVIAPNGQIILSGSGVSFQNAPPHRGAWRELLNSAH